VLQLGLALQSCSLFLSDSVAHWDYQLKSGCPTIGPYLQRIGARDSKRYSQLQKIPRHLVQPQDDDRYYQGCQAPEAQPEGSVRHLLLEFRELRRLPEEVLSKAILAARVRREKPSDEPRTQIIFLNALCEGFVG
jgi:hypothetical protein